MLEALARACRSSGIRCTSGLAKVHACSDSDSARDGRRAYQCFISQSIDGIGTQPALRNLSFVPKTITCVLRATSSGILRISSRSFSKSRSFGAFAESHKSSNQCQISHPFDSRKEVTASRISFEAVAELITIISLIVRFPYAWLLTEATSPL